MWKQFSPAGHGEHTSYPLHVENTANEELILTSDPCYYGNRHLKCRDMGEERETENFFARRTESVDAAGIASLVQRRTETVFGRINVECIM